ncbi:MAG: RNA polymerase sigma factor [Neomegalonema sp.]|nr:RNA polymerase sigma factor [Neomegalonema sp.]
MNEASIRQARQDDADLLAAFAKGDQGAARALTERHLRSVLATAYRMLGDAAEAEDVAQEAMLRVWKIAPDWEAGKAQLSTWLNRVTVNLCYDRLRKKKGSPLDEVPEMEDPSPSVQTRMEQAEGAVEVQAALQQLPERQRAAIVLRHFEERSNPEIAEVLEISVEAVESLLARGRRQLKQLLAPVQA